MRPMLVLLNTSNCEETRDWCSYYHGVDPTRVCKCADSTVGEKRDCPMPGGMVSNWNIYTMLIIVQW